MVIMGGKAIGTIGLRREETVSQPRKPFKKMMITDALKGSVIITPCTWSLRAWGFLSRPKQIQYRCLQRDSHDWCYRRHPGIC
jgi:hypothetical protein